MVWRAFLHAKISRIQNMPATTWSRQPKEKRPHKTMHRRPRATSTQASLIGATEPVLASAMTLFLPCSFHGFAGIGCARDHLIWHLFAGGSSSSSQIPSSSPGPANRRTATRSR